ncbi:MAG: carboxypeptidase regulatory-like domain-containing protein, partial [Anaerolineaceae bacterium]|nr:carboxypeptidase regulatory-like domain-containing protein [Anaerolineaceae bacterium]
APSFDKNRISVNGGCYGLANSAIANFNHGNPSWGNGSTYQWETEIDNHWNSDLNLAKSPHKTFETNDIFNSEETYSNEHSWTVHAAKKIMYYFVAQPYFSSEHWAGKDKSQVINQDYREDIAAILTSGSPVAVGSLAGHAIAATMMISWNDHDKYILWDNNWPLGTLPKNKCGPYLEWYVPDSAHYSYSASNKLCFVENQTGNGALTLEENGQNFFGRILNNLPVFITPDENGDSQNIYNLWDFQVSKKTSAIDHFQRFSDKQQKSAISNPIVDCLFKEHIEILFIGAEINGIYDQSTGNEITLVPNGEIKDGQAVIRQTSAGCFVYVFLPADKTYQIQATKIADFPGVKCFVTIPNGDGTITRLNYDDLEISRTDETQFSFVVGRNNNNTAVQRSIGDVPSPDVNPDYNENLEIALSPPGDFSATYENGSVFLSWTNPDHPDFKTIKIMRSTDTWPQTPEGGDLAYFGSASEFEDTQVVSNTLYFYSAFSIDVQDQAFGPSQRQVDTSLFAISGKVSYATQEALAGSVLTLFNSNGLAIDICTSNSSGQYMFGNIEPGEYSVSASHVLATLQDSQKSTTITKQNIEMDFTALSQPFLVAYLGQDTLSISSTGVFSWAYRDIQNSALVNIDVQVGGNWRTIAQDLPITRGHYSWTPTEPEPGDASFKISLADAPGVFAETDFTLTCSNDADCNGILDLADAVIVLQTLEGSAVRPESGRFDINFDNRMGLEEVLFVLQHVAGLR